MNLLSGFLNKTLFLIKKVLAPLLRLMFVCVLLIIILEFSYFCINHLHRSAKSFLYNAPFLEAYEQVLPSLDPHLGYAHDMDLEAKKAYTQGYTLFEGIIALGPTDRQDVLRVVTLGGSTTDGAQFDGNWPHRLYEIFQREGIPAVVFNAAVGGYTTSQELLRFIRDVIPLHPHVVVSYSGVNENRGTDTGYRMVHPYQVDLMTQIFQRSQLGWLPNMITHAKERMGIPIVKGIYHGVTFKGSPARHWEKNQRSMWALANEFDISFLAILQPSLGLGAYNPSAQEREMIREQNLPLDADFYTEAATIVEKLPFAVSFVDVLDGRSGVYLDYCHLTDGGNSVVAREVFELFNERNLLGQGR